jgi:hypothetical protein
LSPAQWPHISVPGIPAPGQAWGAPPPGQVIAHTNLYWAYPAAPGRTAGTVETKNVDFAGPSRRQCDAAGHASGRRLPAVDLLCGEVRRGFGFAPS